MTLAIDVGNSRIKFGLFARGGPTAGAHVLPEIRSALALSSGAPLDWRQLAASFEKMPPAAAIIAGVDPPNVERILAEWPRTVWPEPRVIRLAAELPLRTQVDAPDKVGVDRLLNAVAANVLRSALQPAIVVGAGTATTIDLISADGAFQGGAILPGLELGARALHQHTALLPLIETRELWRIPVPALGRNTRTAIQSGLWFGQIGAVREIVARLSDDAGAPPLVLATGGNGEWLATALGPQVRFEPQLTLRGLAYVAQANGATG